MNRQAILEDIVRQLINLLMEWQHHGSDGLYSDLSHLAEMIEREEGPWDELKRYRSLVDRMKTAARDGHGIPPDLTRDLWNA